MQRQDSSTLSSQVCGQQEPSQPQRVRELTTEGAQEPSQPQCAWFKKFCKGNESLEDKECSGQSWEGSSDKLRVTTKPDPRTITQEVADELNVDPTAVIRHLKQIGKLKLNKRVPHELTEKKKSFSTVIFSYSTQQ